MSNSELGLEKQLKFTLPLLNDHSLHTYIDSDAESDTTDSESDEMPQKCMVCNHTRRRDLLYSCGNCFDAVCLICANKGYFMESGEPCDEDGICYRCLSEGYHSSKIYFTDYEKLYRICKSIDENSKEKDIYIKQLEEEIKLLKAMVDFQPGGKGYLETMDHFKQLQNNEND
ncbi:MAG: hypothetical protein WD512_16165 [Candidatus Paceibacterota bacterium]